MRGKGKSAPNKSAVKFERESLAPGYQPGAGGGAGELQLWRQADRTSVRGGGGNSGGGEAASLTEPATGGAVDAVTGVAKDSQTNPIA